MKKQIFTLVLSLALLTAPLPCVRALDASSGNGNVTVSLVADCTAAIQSDGSLWTWGWNTHGRLGDGTTNNHNTPVKILDDVVSVDMGSSHSAAIKSDGSLWVWGNNRYHQLGSGIEGNTYDREDHISYQNVPVKVMDDVSVVSVGSFCTVAIKSDGSLWFWGHNSDGQAGSGSNGEEFYEPIKIMDGVTAVSTGGHHIAVIKTDGSLWAWGSNFYGELGNGGRGNERTEYGYVYQTTPYDLKQI